VKGGSDYEYYQQSSGPLPWIGFLAGSSQSFVRRHGAPGTYRPTWAPAADIYETKNDLVAKVDLPGVQEEDIDVRVENNTLAIRREQKFEKEVNEDSYLRVERTFGTFTRSFSLPNIVAVDNISASLQNGVLTIRLPKREEAKPKQIKINVSANGNK
jgi:HSP20 family protein